MQRFSIHRNVSPRAMPVMEYQAAERALARLIAQAKFRDMALQDEIPSPADAAPDCQSVLPEAAPESEEEPDGTHP